MPQASACRFSFLCLIFQKCNTEFSLVWRFDAVPQVLAATFPIGIVSTQIGTLVKLMRVLMLRPVIVALSLFSQKIQGRGVDRRGGQNQSFFCGVFWFIAGFLLLAALRSLDFIPDVAIVPLAKTAGVLTIVSMAALGLRVDLTLIGPVGGRVTMAVLVLISISLILIRLF